MAQPQFSFNTATTSAPALNFGSGGGFSFGAATTSASPLTLNTSTTSTGLSLGSLPSSTANATSFNFPATSSAAPTTTFNFPAATSAAPTSFNFPAATSTAVQPLGGATNNKKVSFTLPSATNPLAATPASSAAPITTGLTSTGPSMAFSELEENLNKWQIMMDELQRPFYSKVAELNATDTLLYENRIKLEKLNSLTDAATAKQKVLNEELNFVDQQQKELDENVTSLEKQLEKIESEVPADTERTPIYKLADALDLQMRKMDGELKLIVDSINEQNQSQDTSDPIVRIGKIINTQISTLLQLDQNIANLSKDVDTISNIQKKL